MINRLIIFLIRKKLGLKKYQYFKFKNQANKADKYYFGDTTLFKLQEFSRKLKTSVKSDISLNFLLSRECIELLEKV